MKEISQRKYSRYYKHILKIISAIIVPLLLATFTVVITFEQRKENDQQRFEDRELARIHREQDSNTSILTREADKLAAQLQRENDREIADKQRNMSQILENYRYEQERIKYLDNLLANYLNEIGQLLKENNGSLTSKSAVAALSRTKTLHILRIGIGSIRASQIIQYLYDAGQLNANDHPLDLSNAPLYGISLNGLSMRSLSLVRTRLSNASFVGSDLSGGDFSGADLKGANFSRTDCSHINFTGANLIQTDFSNANVRFASFHYADLSYSNFLNADCTNTIFNKTIMNKFDFSYAILKQTKFYHVDLTEANFSLAISDTYPNRGCLFDTVTLKKANFTNITASSMKFIKCNLVESIFRGAEVRYISVIFSNATLSDFTYANLYKGTIKASIFTWASFVSSKIQGTEFHYTDLSNANLLNAKCFDDVCSLDEALSIYNATLPNGKLGPFNNLIRNGDVQCNLSVEEHGWIVEEKDSIIIKPSTNNSEKCVFTSSSNFTSPSMSLTVNLSRFIELISTGLAVAMVQSRHSDSLNIDITTDDLKYSFLRPLTSGVDYNTFTGIFLLPDKTKNLIITIEFRPHHYPDLFPVWFDYIQLTIDLCLNKLWYSCPDNPSSFLN